MSLEYRMAQVVDVSYPNRQIDLVVMPYETVASVSHNGRMIEEICTRGAYGHGIAGRKDIKVNRDHDLARTCGRAVKFYPSREEGLIAELYITKADIGEQTLTMADEGLLGASAGFALLTDKTTGKVVKDAEVWETRSRRRLNHLYLDHIALTPQPAYMSAEVLAVRQAAERLTETSLRPNLERLELERLRELHAEMNRRYVGV